MFAILLPNRKTISVRKLARKKVVKRKSTYSTKCSTYSASNDKYSGQRELKTLKLCMYLMTFFHNVCAKNHPQPTFLRVKVLARHKVVKAKSTNFRRCSTDSASDDKNSSQGELKKMKLCMYLVNYFYYVCAKFHPNPTNFRVKGLATKEVVRRKNTKFTRCSTYSASDDNNSSQGELRKMKFCILLVNYFHYVCANFHSNPTTFRVKGLARKKVVKRKSTNFTRCPNFFASSDRISSQGELRKLKFCM